MSKPADFTLPFEAMSMGDHRFEMVVDDDFFAAVPHSLVGGGAARVVVEARRTHASLTLRVRGAGEVGVECDRCLEPLRLPVAFSGELKVHAGAGEYDGEVLFVERGAERLDLAQYIYESLCLALPVSRAHEDEAQCNPEMLARLSR